ncbi:MAG: choloylglycine hydrolase family protein [Halioglobus sp.]|nr:choloylglycine hydrolase family protein [Halioglobus sp.]
MSKFLLIHFRRYIVSICLLSFSYSSFACTAINLTAKDGTVIAGRTMEWDFEMQWELMALPKGTPIDLRAPAPLNLPETKLSSKYAFVAVAPAILKGAPAFLEGQNEAGLGMSGNFLPGFTEYQTVTPQDKHYVSIIDFGRFVLGMFGSVEELRAEVPKYKVWFDPNEVKGIPEPPWLHFVFTDRTGESIVIEFVKGQMMIHDNAASVLTNAPTYEWHLLNVRNYLSLSDLGTSSVMYNGASVTDIGQGGGLLGLPADYTPPSRFIRAAYLTHFATQPNGRSDATQLMAHLLNNVDIPLGVSQSKKGKETIIDYTQWVAIKDLTHNQMIIADYAHRTNYIQIDLNRVFQSNKSMTWPITELPYPTSDVTSQLIE